MEFLKRNLKEIGIREVKKFSNPSGRYPFVRFKFPGSLTTGKIRSAASSMGFLSDVVEKGNGHRNLRLTPRDKGGTIFVLNTHDESDLGKGAVIEVVNSHFGPAFSPQWHGQVMVFIKRLQIR